MKELPDGTVVHDDGTIEVPEETRHLITHNKIANDTVPGPGAWQVVRVTCRFCKETVRVKKPARWSFGERMFLTCFVVDPERPHHNMLFTDEEPERVLLDENGQPIAIEQNLSFKRTLR